MKLTTAAIAKRPAPMTGVEWVWDEEVPGFGAKIPATGARSYVLRYRAAGVDRKQKLGACNVLTADKARTEARRLLAQVAQGRDPMSEKKAAREAARCPAAASASMADLSVRYMVDYAIPHKKPRSIEEDRRAWSKHILPALGARDVATITKADVMALHAKMKATPAVANYVVAVLGKAFNLCEDWGWRGQNTNPCHRFPKFTIAGREMILTGDEIRAIDRACTQLADVGEIAAPMAALVRLWMLTGCRNTELRLARREWLDAQACALRLPDSKSGARVIPLPAAAMAILAALPADGPWLFPGASAGQPIRDPWGAWKRICVAAGVREGATPHTLRHTAGSMGHSAGLSQKQIAEQLGHRQLSTTEIYLHGVAAETAQAAEKIAGAITAHWESATA